MGILKLVKCRKRHHGSGAGIDIWSHRQLADAVVVVVVVVGFVLLLLLLLLPVVVVAVAVFQDILAGEILWIRWSSIKAQDFILHQLRWYIHHQAIRSVNLYSVVLIIQTGAGFCPSTVWLSISFASLFPFVPATFWAGCCASCVNALCLGVSTRCSKIKELFLSFRYIILPFQPWMFNCVRQSQWFQSIKTGCLSSSRRLSGSGFFWTAHVDRCTFVCSGPDPKLRKKQARCSNLAWSFNTLWKTCTSVRSIVMRDALVVSSLCAQTLFDAWPFSPFASELKMANWALPFHQPALLWQASNLLCW